MRAAWAVVLIAVSGGLAAIACSSFTSDDGPGEPGSEAGSDAAPPSGDADPTDAQIVDAGEAGADSSCVGLDFVNDVLNCGTCGHDCVGGGCEAGVCQVKMVSTSPANISAITATDAGVFFLAASDSVLGCPFAGCTMSPAAFSSGFSTPTALATLGDQIAVGTPKETYIVGSGGAHVLIGGGYSFVSSMVSDGQHSLYYVTDGNLYHYDSATDAGVRPVLTPTAQPLTNVAIAAGHIYYYSKSSTEYFGACSAPQCTSPHALVGNRTLGGGDVQLAAAADGIFWNRPISGPISSCPTAGCSNEAQVFSTSTYQLLSLAVDDDYVYFATNQGRVERCPHTGCGLGGPFDIATNQFNPHALVVSGKALYWATDGNGALPPTVWRVAR